jgi:hypothetical protein
MTSQMKKEFDCIEMKRDAQARIFEEIKGMSPQEQIEYFRHAIQSSRFGEWWERTGKPSGGVIKQAS